MVHVLRGGIVWVINYWYIIVSNVGMMCVVCLWEELGGVVAEVTKGGLGALEVSQ